jgi:hypothetical protein
LICVFRTPLDSIPGGSAAPASREGTGNPELDFCLTRDCQSIAGFLLKQNAGTGVSKEKYE